MGLGKWFRNRTEFMTLLIRILISWNVFSLYLTKTLLNNNTDRADYNFSNSILVILNASQVLFITEYFQLKYWEIIFGVLTGFHLLIGFIYEKKIKQGFVKFKDLGFNKFYILFMIYFFTGVLFFLWIIFQPKRFV